MRKHPDRNATTVYAPKGGGYVVNPDLGYVNDPADAEFIAHAREDVPALLSEVDRLRRLVERLEAIAREPYEPDEFAALDEARREILSDVEPVT